MTDTEHEEWLRDREAQKRAKLLRKKGHKNPLKAQEADEPTRVGESTAESEDLVDEYLDDGDEDEEEVGE